jgi:hypothetical protein
MTTAIGHSLSAFPLCYISINPLSVASRDSMPIEVATYINVVAKTGLDSGFQSF